jgi:hypothetical protein
MNAHQIPSGPNQALGLSRPRQVWQRVEQEMSPGQQFRLDIIVEASHRWRWQIFEGERLVKQSAPIYASRGDANRAGIVEQWELIAESEEGPQHF